MTHYLVHVLLLGSLYAALAVGFCLYFGTMRLINFAHGDVFTVGAFTCLLVTERFGPVHGIAGMLLLLLVAGIAGLLLGPLIEIAAFRGLRGGQPHVLLLTSVAVSIVLREGLAWAYPDGRNPHQLPDPLLGSLNVAGAEVSSSRILTVILAVAAVLLVVAWVRRSAMGRRLRATSEDPIAAGMIGINVDKIMVAAFAVASVLGCVAGGLYAVSYGVVRYDMGLLMGLRAFAAAALGGLSRVEGALLGGVTLAALELGVSYLMPGGSGYRDVVVFAVLVLVLSCRPQGLLGRPPADVGTSLARASLGGDVR